MTIAAQPEAPPLHQDNDGAVRVGNSRVLLELVIRAFQDGATPETITYRYNTLSLADVYSVIAYYLRHPDQIDAYLIEREQLAGEVRDQVQSNLANLDAIRARLLARRRTP